MLSRTVQEPLGTLPVPVRTAVLQTAAQLDPETVEAKVNSKLLMYGEGQYRWVSRWRFINEDVRRLITGRNGLTHSTYHTVEDYVCD